MASNVNDLTTAQKYIEKLESESEVLKEIVKEKEDEVKKHEEEKTESDVKISELEKEVEDLKEQLKEATTTKDASDEKFEELEEELKEKEEELKKYKELGEPEELEEVLEKVNDTIASLINAGGSKEEIIEKLQKVSELEEELAQYHAIGTPEEIIKIISDFKDLKFEKKSEELAEETGVEKETAKIALEKMESYAEARNFLKSVVKGNVSKGTRRVEKVESEAKGKIKPIQNVDKLAALKNAIRHL